VLEITGGGGETLAVDANGRFDLETAKAYGQAMAPFNLKWYEEAGDPLDYQLQKELSADYPATHAMATGENLFSMQDARNLIRYGGMHPGTVRKTAVLPRSNSHLETRWSFYQDRLGTNSQGGKHSNKGHTPFEQDILQFDPALSYGLVEYLPRETYTSSMSSAPAKLPLYLDLL
jgi:hypothetical protein